MKILILEDMDFRIDIFKSKLSRHELTIVKTAKEAIDLLKKNLDYGTIFLDHDLGGEIFVDSEKENTGYQVAKFLGESGVTCPIFIHSMNFGGAARMRTHIPKAIHMPFSYLFNGESKWNI